MLSTLFTVVLPWLLVAVGYWLFYQILRQNGRILLRLEALEEQIAHPGAAPAAHPAVLQRHWEISMLYGMFATPIAYLIDEQGVLATDVVVGDQPIRDLLTTAAQREPVPISEGNGAYAASGTA